MAYYFHRIILIALVFVIGVPSSLGDRGDGDPPAVQPGEFDSVNYVKELCSQTNHAKECWYFIKSQFNRFNMTKTWGMLGVTDIVPHLVQEKAYQIQDKLNKLYGSSKDRDLKLKYLSCSNNYNNAIVDIELAKLRFSNLDLDSILVHVDGADEELKHCVSKFTENSFDPAHIRNENKVLGIYIELLKVTMINWIDSKRQG